MSCVMLGTEARENYVKLPNSKKLLKTKNILCVILRFFCSHRVWQLPTSYRDLLIINGHCPINALF